MIHKYKRDHFKSVAKQNLFDYNNIYIKAFKIWSQEIQRKTAKTSFSL